MKRKPHQVRAVDDINITLQQNDRAQYISACGTGKTLVGYDIVNNILSSNTNKTIILFFPSLALIAQTYKSYLSYGLDISNNEILFVCSDESVYEEEDLPIGEFETNFKVTTNSEEIATFMKQNSTKNKIIFCTYHSSKILSDNMNTKIDFALYDEAHRTATSNDSYYNYSLDNNNISITKRLFMTATPKHRKINTKNIEEEQYLFSMNNEEIYGSIANKYTLREAIDDEVISPYQIIIAVATKDEISKLQKKDTKNIIHNAALKQEAKILALNNAMQKYSINKGIVFAERINKSKSYLETFKKHNHAIFTQHIDSSFTTQEINNIFDQFDNSKKGLLFNAQILSEGIDIPAIELAAFMEKSTSSVNIAQRIGRATRLDPQNPHKIGYIFIPIFISEEEDINNFNTSSDLGEMLEIINTMAEQDQELYAELYNRRVFGNNSSSNIIKIIHTNETKNFELKDDLEKKITTLIINKIIPNWYKNYELLREYYEEFGEWPAQTKIYKDVKIGIWLSHQKGNYKKGQLSDDRIALLDSIDESWKNTPDESWNENFELLREYYEEFGEWPAQTKIYKDVKIGIWLSIQKGNYKKGQLSDDRIALLDSIDESWKISRNEKDDERWNENFELLR
ncbi:MAG: Helicase associated domain protein, partial [Sulfurovaceae bacterium]|nr:Helicase associated domain protein [Sulfurovaceae bacterium]